MLKLNSCKFYVNDKKKYIYFEFNIFKYLVYVEVF